MKYHLLMKEAANKWLDQAIYDFGVARTMYRTRRYAYTVFFCHLSIEKALKACIVEYADIFPPKSHNLIRLAKQAKIELPAELSHFLDSLSKESVHTRYPEDLDSFTKNIAGTCLLQTEKVLLWLQQKLTSNP